MEYNFSQIEKKWQEKWKDSNIFKASEDSDKEKFYCLDMFPYPSAKGIHVGHLKGYTFSDVIAKKKMMEGYNVLHPMGWDAFGLPAENFAIKTGIHPADSTAESVENIKAQLVSAGFGYDWSRELNTSTPDYYKWTQWLFIQLYKKGLAYKKKTPVNFCPHCKTVLANEQVVNGACERCDAEVEKKNLSQWFFKITSYADRLLNDLEKIDWPKNVKLMQTNWIGKSEGALIKFPIADFQFPIKVFTTRTDTLFGCTYLVISPENPLLDKIKEKISNPKEVEEYLNLIKHSPKEANKEEKSGVELKGVKAVNPINNERLPIFVGSYVLMEYGTGAIMGVPAHDQRDFEFASRHNLPIRQVIVPPHEYGGEELRILKAAYEEEGILINSGKFSGMNSAKAKEKITETLEEKEQAEKETNYKLKDWLVSRQRYWGCPIPIVYCANCWNNLKDEEKNKLKEGIDYINTEKGSYKVVTVSEDELPVELPDIKEFKPAGEGKSPLANSEEFMYTKCPVCGETAGRETDTLDTFVDSSWYYLRYTDPNNKEKFASKEEIDKWMPVDLYIGGVEHAVLHLLYARFFTKFLFDNNLVNFEEPFSKLFNPGVVYRKGAKMSKSKGNVVSPDSIAEKYGADTMRLYELFMGPANQATEWSDKGVVGCYRFLQKIWRLQSKVKDSSKKNQELEKSLHKTIKKVTEDIEKFRFNTAISSLMILANKMEKASEIDKYHFEVVSKLLAPMAPHICEELYKKFGSTEAESVFETKWPEYNFEMIEEETFQLIIQINGKMRDKVELEKDVSEEEAKDNVLQREKVKKHIGNKQIKNIIFVPNKLINIVV